MTKKKKGVSSMSKTKGSSMQRKNIGGLGDYIVQKIEKEVIFYLENPFKFSQHSYAFQELGNGSGYSIRPTCLGLLSWNINIDPDFSFFFWNGCIFTDVFPL